MKPFRFKQFKIEQDANVFRVGTDAVLLGSLCSAEKRQKILEVGTGTGIITLMIAQRNPQAQIFALDINPYAADLTKRNFEQSPFCGRLSVELKDFNEFQSEEKFDFIVSNPPYFEENLSHKDKFARQTVALNFSQLVQNSKKLLTENGVLSVILPYNLANQFSEISNKNELYPQRIVNIFGKEGGSVIRTILEFGLKKIELTEEDFTIEKSPRKYSDQYLELTKEFHIFSK